MAEGRRVSGEVSSYDSLVPYDESAKRSQRRLGEQSQRMDSSPHSTVNCQLSTDSGDGDFFVGAEDGAETLADFAKSGVRLYRIIDEWH